MAPNRVVGVVVVVEASSLARLEAFLSCVNDIGWTSTHRC